MRFGFNNGNITSKKLAQLFDVGKKNPERQALFKRIVDSYGTMHNKEGCRWE